MRRSSRPLLPAPVGEEIILAALACAGCGRLGCTVVGLWRDERGAAEWSWCSPACAAVAGWPWLVSERAPKRRRAA